MSNVQDDEAGLMESLGYKWSSIAVNNGRWIKAGSSPVGHDTVVDFFQYLKQHDQALRDKLLEETKTVLIGYNATDVVTVEHIDAVLPSQKGKEADV